MFNSQLIDNPTIMNPETLKLLQCIHDSDFIIISAEKNQLLTNQLTNQFGIVSRRIADQESFLIKLANKKRLGDWLYQHYFMCVKDCTPAPLVPEEEQFIDKLLKDLESPGIVAPSVLPQQELEQLQLTLDRIEQQLKAIQQFLAVPPIIPHPKIQPTLPAKRDYWSHSHGQNLAKASASANRPKKRPACNINYPGFFQPEKPQGATPLTMDYSNRYTVKPS